MLCCIFRCRVHHINNEFDKANIIKKSVQNQKIRAYFIRKCFTLTFVYNMEMDSYLTKDEKELLLLIEYHRKHYRENEKRQGGLHPDDYEIMKHFDYAEEFVRIAVKDRKEREEKHNEGKAQLKWLEEAHEKITNHKNISKLPNEVKKDIIEIEQRLKDFRKVFEIEEKAYQDLLQAEEKRTEVIIQYRDYFLVAKLQDKWGDAPMGES